MYFPLYADITGKLCVVVGGGPVAERKVADLLEADAAIRVISPDVTDALRALAEAGKIVWIRTTYEARHLEDVWLVFAATNNREVNARIAYDAQARRLFANIADAPDEGSFFVPSVVRRGALCLSISTGGNNPMLARKVAQELSAQYGPEYGLLVELLGQMRVYIKARTPDPAMRRVALARLIDHADSLRALLRSGETEAARSQAVALIEDIGTATDVPTCGVQ